MNQTNKSLISLIIPTCRQKSAILKDIVQISEVMESISISYEIIVVFDGREKDDYFQNAKKMENSKIKIVGYKDNHGKGYAVRYGMAQSKGDIIGFMDAGGEIRPESLILLLDYFRWYKADIVIGSKRHSESKVSYPWQRKILSWGYQVFIKIFFGLNVRDTQVGLKIFRRKVLETVLPRILVKKFAFDVEMLAVAYHLGFKRIYEAPVNLDFSGASNITRRNFWRIILRTLWDTIAVYYRLKILKYYENSSQRKWRFDEELNFRVNTG